MNIFTKYTKIFTGIALVGFLTLTSPVKAIDFIIEDQAGNRLGIYKHDLAKKRIPCLPDRPDLSYFTVEHIKIAISCLGKNLTSLMPYEFNLAFKSHSTPYVLHDHDFINYFYSDKFYGLESSESESDRTLVISPVPYKPPYKTSDYVSYQFIEPVLGARFLEPQKDLRFNLLMQVVNDCFIRDMRKHLSKDKFAEHYRALVSFIAQYQKDENTDKFYNNILGIFKKFTAWAIRTTTLGYYFFQGNKDGALDLRCELRRFLISKLEIEDVFRVDENMFVLRVDYLLSQAMHLNPSPKLSENPADFYAKSSCHSYDCIGRKYFDRKYSGNYNEESGYKNVYRSIPYWTGPSGSKPYESSPPKPSSSMNLSLTKDNHDEKEDHTQMYLQFSQV